MIGVGCDIERAGRFRKELKNRRFLRTIFTPAEIRRYMGMPEPEVHFAMGFASKEAVFKALSALGDTVPLKEVRIEHPGGGRMRAVRISYNGIGRKYKIFVDASSAGGTVFAASVAERKSRG